MVPEKRTAPAGWIQKVRITTVGECRSDYDGPLDFAFVVHPRTFEKNSSHFQNCGGCQFIWWSNFKNLVVVLSLLEIEIAGRRIRGGNCCAFHLLRWRSSNGFPMPAMHCRL